MKRGLAPLAMLVGVACSQPRPPAHPVHPEPPERGTALVGNATPAQPLLDVQLLALSVSDDDGARPARVTEQQIASWVSFSNDVFRPAGVRFRLDPSDVQRLRSTRINDLMGDQAPDWGEVKRAADEIADRYPDRLVVFFRHGPGARATGFGFSWTDYNFVVMPGWSDDRHCGHDHLSALAHELGHQLGLLHTFVRPFDELSEAATFLEQHRGDVRAFDGDALLDTSPDPSIRATECIDTPQIELNGLSIPLARRNIMSYYDERDSLSAAQIERVRWFLLERRAHRMKLPKNHPRAPLEAEQLEIVDHSGGRCTVQPMDRFGAGNWSDGRQLFCDSRGGPQTLRVRLPVANSGLARLELYVTRAPDYGIVEVLLDGEPLGAAYDAWAPAVLASGAISLGERRIAAGIHELTFVVRAKNRASTGFELGLDAIALLPREPLS